MKKILVIVLAFILFIPSNNSKMGGEIPKSLPSKEDIFGFLYSLERRIKSEKFFKEENIIEDLVTMTGKVEYIMDNGTLWLEEAIKSFYVVNGIEYNESKIEKFVNELDIEDEGKIAIAYILFSYSKAVEAKSLEEKMEGILATINAVRKTSSLLKALQVNEPMEDAYKKIIIGGNERNIYKNYTFIIDFGGDDAYKKGNSSFILDFDGNDVYENRNSPDSVTMIFDINGNDKYYDCPSTSNSFSLLFDLTGNDIYEGATCSSYDNGTSLLIDMEGDDVYKGESHAQSFSSYATSLLIDVSGDDRYSAYSYSQASTIGGISILADFYGDDIFIAKDKSQAFASGTLKKGAALLINFKGNDFYKAENYSQSYGEGAAFSMLLDFIGRDIYKAGYYAQASASWMGFAAFMDADQENEFSHGLFSQGYKMFGGLSFFMNGFEVRGNEEMMMILELLQSNFRKFFP